MLCVRHEINPQRRPDPQAQHRWRGLDKREGERRLARPVDTAAKAIRIMATIGRIGGWVVEECQRLVFSIGAVDGCVGDGECQASCRSEFVTTVVLSASPFRDVGKA